MPTTPPTLISANTVGWNTTSTPVTQSITVQVGDVILVKAGSEDSPNTLGTPTNTGTAFTWNPIQSVVVASYAPAYAWYAVASAAITTTVSVARTAGGGQFGMVVEVWRGSAGIGTSAKNNVPSPATPTLNVTCSANSALSQIITDWNTTNGAGRTYPTINGFTPVAGGAGEDNYTLANSTFYSTYWPDTGTAGVKTVGVSIANEQYAIIGVEILGTTTAGAATITATADQQNAQVRLDLDFTSVDAPYVLVERINEMTGVATAVRPHGLPVSANGVINQPLYAGYKTVMYDTEAPLDTPVHYRATAVADQLNVNADFEEGLVAPWTPANGATIWAPETMVVNGVGNQFPVVGHSGTHALAVRGNGATANPQAQAEFVPVTVGAALSAAAWAWSIAAQAVSFVIAWYDAALSPLSTSTVGSPTLAAQTWTQISGNVTVPASAVFGRLRVQVTGTPAFDVPFLFDQIQLLSTAAVATSNTVTLFSADTFWLKDPQRPGRNLPVFLCWDPKPECLPSKGIFMAPLDAETATANLTLLNVNNQPEPIGVYRQRSSLSSVLRVVSRTFPDRDDLRLLLQPGSPIFTQWPDEYGVEDAYLAVSDVTWGRLLPDMRFQPRAFVLPYQVTLSPPGPASGVVHARWQDQCNRYASWGAVTAAGITWLALLQGAAG